MVECCAAVSIPVAAENVCISELPRPVDPTVAHRLKDNAHKWKLAHAMFSCQDVVVDGSISDAPVGVGKVVSLDNTISAEPSALMLHLTAGTDLTGHFVFEKVPPGQWMLSPHTMNLEISAGQTAEVVDERFSVESVAKTQALLLRGRITS